MHEITSFLLRHGYGVMCLTVLAEQLGLPLPATPFLLAVGALAGLGHFSFVAALALATAAAVVGDAVWYELGRRKGNAVLRLLCKISLEPDSCVNNTRIAFERRGSRTLLIAKFVPGLSTMAPPMAGVTRMAFGRFLLADTAGAALWAGAFLALGFVFNGQLEAVAEWAGRLGKGLGVLLFALLGGYLAVKYYQRRRFIRSLRVARITPEEVIEKVQAGEPMVILDMRGGHVNDADLRLPGSLVLRYDELSERHTEIPRDRDVILYCT